MPLIKLESPRSVGKPGSNPPSSQGESRIHMKPSNASTVEAAHHSSHSAKRSEHYHSRVADIVKPVQIDSGKNKMTRSIHAKSSMEEDTASDGDAFRG